VVADTDTNSEDMLRVTLLDISNLITTPIILFTIVRAIKNFMGMPIAIRSDFKASSD
jgi:hypothetical protein